MNIKNENNEALFLRFSLFNQIVGLIVICLLSIVLYEALVNTSFNYTSIIIVLYLVAFAGFAVLGLISLIRYRKIGYVIGIDGITIIGLIKKDFISWQDITLSKTYSGTIEISGPRFNKARAIIATNQLSKYDVYRLITRLHEQYQSKHELSMADIFAQLQLIKADNKSQSARVNGNAANSFDMQALSTPIYSLKDIKKKTGEHQPMVEKPIGLKFAVWLNYFGFLSMLYCFSQIVQLAITDIGESSFNYGDLTAYLVFGVLGLIACFIRRLIIYDDAKKIACSAYVIGKEVLLGPKKLENVRAIKITRWAYSRGSSIYSVVLTDGVVDMTCTLYLNYPSAYKRANLISDTLNLPLIDYRYNWPGCDERKFYFSYFLDDCFDYLSQGIMFFPFFSLIGLIGYQLYQTVLFLVKG